MRMMTPLPAAVGKCYRLGGLYLVDKCLFNGSGIGAGEQGAFCEAQS